MQDTNLCIFAPVTSETCLIKACGIAISIRDDKETAITVAGDIDLIFSIHIHISDRSAQGPVIARS